MKKVLVMAVLALTTITGAYANEVNEYNVFNKLNNEKTFKSLNRYLKLNDCQQVNLKTEFLLTTDKLKKAVESNDEMAIQDAMTANLINLKEILTPEQYEKFVIALNTTIENVREVQYLAAE